MLVQVVFDKAETAYEFYYEWTPCFINIRIDNVYNIVNFEYADKEAVNDIENIVKKFCDHFGGNDNVVVTVKKNKKLVKKVIY